MDTTRQTEHQAIVGVAIVDGPITQAVERASIRAMEIELDSPTAVGSVGARLRFEGVVRQLERDTAHDGLDRPLAALVYETYDPMAQHELESLATRVALEHQLVSLVALHSRGSVGVGEISFVLMITSTHRAEALAAMDAFIDQLKRDVPIWKQPDWA